jgi:hypothetical protein
VRNAEVLLRVKEERRGTSSFLKVIPVAVYAFFLVFPSLVPNVLCFIQ